jgi:plastocyanin
LALAATGLALPIANAGAANVPVNIEFQAFRPTPLDVLPGETVEWQNISERRHTVTADDGLFDSGDVLGGQRFTAKFDVVGSYAYHCRIHPGMTGEVDVRRVTLGLLPPDLVPAGQSVEVDGRTADPGSPVLVERNTGAGFETVATARPGSDGTWKATVTAEKTAGYRAALGSDVSETRKLLVSDRKVLVNATRRRVSVRVVPPDPYAHVVLELKLRERFGWWPAVPARLDYLSEAHFRVRGPVSARVALLDRDGWTPLAISRIVRMRR